MTKSPKMQPYLYTILLLCQLMAAGALPAQEAAPKQPRSRFNVLFLCIDDLRPELRCYGNPVIHSPHIDALAASGVRFTNHFVVVPTCGPSRACLLTGKWPRNVDEISNDVLEKKQDAGIPLGKPESLVENMRLQGYYSVGIGKISHSPDGYMYKYLEQRSNRRELPHSWDEMLLNAGSWGTGWNAFFGYAGGSNRNALGGMVKPFECADVGDEEYPDGLTANLTVEKLKELAKNKQPFFLGVGFFKPHLPFNAPKKYWNLYDEASLALTPSPAIPDKVNPVSLQESSEFNGYKSGEEKASLSKPVSAAYARKLRHGYYAAVSYVDAQVGKVLDELKRLGLEKNTIVVLWGDHGWHLGDDLVWGKHTLSEWALRSPLIVRVPGIGKPGVANGVVSSIDIYPTLMELCGLDKPAGLDGSSFVGLLQRPATKKWNNTAYSYFKQGISLRTERYRLTRYYRAEKPDIELYDHTADRFENVNVAQA